MGPKQKLKHDALREREGLFFPTDLKRIWESKLKPNQYIHNTEGMKDGWGVERCVWSVRDKFLAIFQQVVVVFVEILVKCVTSYWLLTPWLTIYPHDTHEREILCNRFKNRKKKERKEVHSYLQESCHYVRVASLTGTSRSSELQQQEATTIKERIPGVFWGRATHHNP